MIGEVKKSLPTYLTNVEVIESWLSDMAKKGLILNKISNKATFYKRSPRNAQYKLVPLCKREKSPDIEVLQYYRECGWVYVTTASGLFHIYVSNCENPSEIHSDPIVESYAYKFLLKKCTLESLFALAMVLITIFYVFRDYIISGTPILKLINDDIYSQIFLLFSIVIIVFRCIINVINLKRILSNLKDGNLEISQKKYRTHMKLNKVSNFIIPSFIFVLFISTFFCEYSSWKMGIKDYEKEVPVISMSEIEKEKIYTYGYLNENTISFKKTFLAPCQYSFKQKGLIRNDDINKTDLYVLEVDVNYYELRVKFFAEPLVEEYKNSIDNKNLNFQIKEVYLEDFEKAYILANEKGEQYFIGCKNEKVVFINYKGKENLEKITKERKLRI